MFGNAFESACSRRKHQIDAFSIQEHYCKIICTLITIYTKTKGLNEVDREQTNIQCK
jgi:hypothetical protein